MKSLSINVEVCIGTSPEEACKDALMLACQLDLMVTFDFNGVYMCVAPQDKHVSLVNYFHKEIEKPRKRGITGER